MAELTPMVIIDTPERIENEQPRRNRLHRNGITVYIKTIEYIIFNSFKTAALVKCFVAIGIVLLLVGGWEVGNK